MMSFPHVPAGPEAIAANLRARVTKLEAEVERIGQTLRDSLCAVARPGDTVILAFGRELTDEDIEHLTEGFRPLKERGIEVAFTDQVESITVVRPDDIGPDEEAFEALAASDENRYGPEDV